MLRFHGRFLGWLGLVGWLTIAAHTAQGGPPRARTLKYDPNHPEWVEVPPPPMGTSEGDLYAIRLQIRDGQYGRALKAAKQFARKYEEDDPEYPGLLIAKAEALVGQREYYKAHEVLQEFLDRFAGTRLTSEALRLEFVIAEAYLSGTKRKFAGVRLLSGVELAYTILDDISTGYPEDPLAELAIKTKADHLFAKGEHDLAQMEYTNLLREHPQSRYHQYALRRTAEAALASFAGVPYDDTPLIEAEERFREYRGIYAGSPDSDDIDLILATIRERRAEKELQVGEYYQRTDHLSSAIYYYELVRREWPDTAAARQATIRLELLGVIGGVSETEPS